MTDAEELVLRELQRVSSYLRELVSYKRRSDLRDALADDADKRTAYELSDGARTSNEVKDDGELSVSARSVQRWWNSWVDQALAERLANGSIRARYDTRVIDVDIEKD